MAAGNLAEIWEKDIQVIAERYYAKIRVYGLESARGIDNRSHEEHNAFFSALFDGVIIEGGVSVLDVGCGRGELVLFLQQMYPRLKLLNYLGVDLIAEFVDYCQKSYPNYTFRQVNFMGEDFAPNQTFELVVALGVLVKRVRCYGVYVKRFMEKMIHYSSKYVLLNLISDVDVHSEDYMGQGEIGHSTSFSLSKLEAIMSKIPGVTYRVVSKRIYHDATDLFIQIKKRPTQGMQQ